MVISQNLNGDDVSERFVNYLYRIANVPIITNYGKMPVRIEQEWKSVADEVVKEFKTEYRRIPLRYTFLNPLTLEAIAPEITQLAGKSIYGLKLNNSLKVAIGRLKSRYPNIDENQLLKLIPEDILNALKNNLKIIPLDEDRLSIYFYKKDSWDVWAKTMVSSILDDLMILDKMKLADVSALDGAISTIRLWRLGRLTDNPATCIIPKTAMLNKVRSILANNVAVS